MLPHDKKAVYPRINGGDTYEKTQIKNQK